MQVFKAGAHHADVRKKYRLTCNTGEGENHASPLLGGSVNIRPASVHLTAAESLNRGSESDEQGNSIGQGGSVFSADVSLVLLSVGHSGTIPEEAVAPLHEFGEGISR